MGLVNSKGKFVTEGFPDGSAGKESACNAGDVGSIPGLGRFPWRRERLPTPVSGPENSKDCVVRGVAKSRTRLGDFHFHCSCMTAGRKAWQGDLELAETSGQPVG